MFTIEQRWDAELRVLYERYADFYGTEYEETKGGLSSAGYVGSRQLVALDDGEPYSTTVETTVLDGRGRPLAAFRSDDLHWIGVRYEAAYTADWSCD